MVKMESLEQTTGPSTGVMNQQVEEAYVNEGLALRSGHDWIQSCMFHDLTPSEVLGRVEKRVADHRLERPQTDPFLQLPGLVVFDLDSTLYEVKERTYHILRDWVESERSEHFPNVRITLSGLMKEQVGYSIRETFHTIGLLDSHFRHEIEDGLVDVKEFWTRYFFSNDYLECDRPYDGAQSFVWKLYDLGAEIMYLSGRDEKNMGDGTRQSLRRFGFPMESQRTHLRLKPNGEMPDLEFKQSIVREIKSKWVPLAAFENEPINLCMFHDSFPESLNVFVQTVWSNRPAPPRNGLFRIQCFE